RVVPGAAREPAHEDHGQRERGEDRDPRGLEARVRPREDLRQPALPSHRERRPGDERGARERGDESVDDYGDVDERREPAADVLRREEVERSRVARPGARTIDTAADG